MNFSYVCVFLTLVLATYVASRPIIHPKKAIVTISKKDQQAVLNCFLASRGVDNRSCWLLDNSTIHVDVIKFREILAMHYYYMLVDAFSQIDRCLHLEAKMITLPRECSYLDDVDLVEHCFLHHQMRQYKPCQGISYPHIALPSDVRTLFRYSTWLNISTEYEAQHKPKNKDDLKALVNHCLRSNSWPWNSICHGIVHPNPHQKYDHRMKRMQVAFKQMDLLNRKRDCEYFHQDDLKNGVGECANDAASFQQVVDVKQIELQLAKTPAPSAPWVHHWRR